LLGHAGHLRAEMIGDNQRARSRLKLRLGFHHANWATATSHLGGGKESCCGSSDDDDFGRVTVRWLDLAIVHSPVDSQWEQFLRSLLTETAPEFGLCFRPTLAGLLKEIGGRAL